MTQLTNIIKALRIICSDITHRVGIIYSINCTMVYELGRCYLPCQVQILAWLCRQDTGAEVQTRGCRPCRRAGPSRLPTSARRLQEHEIRPWLTFDCEKLQILSRIQV